MIVRVVIVMVLAIALLLPAGAAAQDPCSVIKRGAPARHAGDPRPPLVVGDSTALLAVDPLVRLGLEADTRGCRQIGPAVDILAARRSAGTLGRVGVLIVGSNGSVPRSELRRALKVMGPRRVLGLVTTPTPASNAQAMRSFHARHPTRTILIDWSASGIPQSYGGDGLHIGYEGEARMARFINRYVRPYTPPKTTIAFPDDLAAAKSCGAVHPGERNLEVLVIRGRDRVRCSTARQLALAKDPTALRYFNWFNWRFLGKPPWTDVYVRRDGKVIVAVRRPAPAPAPGTHRPAS